MKERILVTFAVEPEFQPWRRLRRFRQASLDHLSVYRAEMGNAEVMAALTGVGARQMQCVLSCLDDLPRPFAGVVAGVAAGLKADLRPGEILAAKSVCGPGQMESMQSDSTLLQLAVQCGAKPVERFLTLPQVARTAQEKWRLSHQGDAAEMESLTVMKQLSRHGVPVVAIRVIADPVDKDLPCDFEAALDAEGQVRIRRILARLVHKPQALLGLVQFGLVSRRAMVALARYLDCFVERLANQTSCALPLVAVEK